MSKFSYSNRRSHYIISPLQSNLYPPQKPDVEEEQLKPPILLKKEKSVKELIPIFDKFSKPKDDEIKLIVNEVVSEKLERSVSVDSSENFKPFPPENKVLNKLLKLNRYKSAK